MKDDNCLIIQAVLPHLRIQELAVDTQLARGLGAVTLARVQRALQQQFFQARYGVAVIQRQQIFHGIGRKLRLAEPEVLHINDGAAHFHVELAHEVFKLADIARPGIFQ